jgi:pimeloyl-ACP methyl ester carboxylesterase
MIVWGANDAIIPVAHAHSAHEAIPGSRLEILDDVGHFPHAEDPEQFNELMLDFMATTEPGPDDEIDLRTALIAAGD